MKTAGKTRAVLWASAWAVLTAAAGCGPTLEGGRVVEGKLKFYDGPTLPRHETATVLCDRCGIFAVNGRTISRPGSRAVRYAQSVAVLPGRHVFDVQLPVQRGDDCRGLTGYSELSAKVQAGLVYYIRTVVECQDDTGDSAYWLWMEEDPFGKVVGGEPPP